MGALGPLEQRVMEAVWESPRASVREVAERMREDADRAYTTIMTTLDRLYRKGLLRREKDGLAWRYTARVDRVELERHLADHLAAELVAHGETGLAALVDASADSAMLDRLEALIQARRCR